MDKHCAFCRIAEGEASADILYQDERITAFHDRNPQAPTHVLVIPNRHIASLDEASTSDSGLLGDLLLTARKLARRLNLNDAGYRVVINTGSQAGQSIMHLHVHLLGGRRLSWPPG